MADKEADNLKRGPSNDLLNPVSKKPRDGTDQSQGSEPQNTQPDVQPIPDLELQDILPDLELQDIPDLEQQELQDIPHLKLQDIPHLDLQDIRDLGLLQDILSEEELPDIPDLELQDILPEEYEWRICDMSSDREANEVSSFVKKYYLQCESSPIAFEYSKDFLQWSLCPPGFKKNWHIGVQDKSTKQLVAFIAAVPVNIRLHEQDVVMAEVKYVYILQKGKSLGLEPLLMEEMVRIVSTQTVHVAYAAPDEFPTKPLAACQCWIRPLNVEKLIDLKIMKLGEGKTVETEHELYSLQTFSPTHGLRKMEVKDIPSVTTLLRSYLGRFALAPRFNEIEVGHWFLPRANVVECYVVEENKDITHFISFHVLPFSATGVKDSTINTACSLYNVSTKAHISELLMDALILAKLHGSVIFKALDLMDNNVLVLTGLKFRDGRKHYYYLHDETLSKELKPWQIGRGDEFCDESQTAAKPGILFCGAQNLRLIVSHKRNNTSKLYFI